MPLLKKSCWTHSLTFLAGLICGSLFLSGHVTRRYTRGGEVGRILQSSTGNEVGCPVEALSASTGQGVHSFMTQEFKKATSPNSDKVLTHVSQGFKILSFIFLILSIHVCMACTPN